MRFLPMLLFAIVAVAAERPNVLFIAVDDLRPELGTYGSRAITPNIDRLANSALQFDRAYCNQAVCGASRVSLMTGLYPEYTKERSYHVSNWRQRWPQVVTLNQHFTDHGYNTVGLGKINHGSNGSGVDPKNWTEWISVTGQQYADPASEAAMKAAHKDKKKRRGPATEAAQAGDDFHADGKRASIGAARLHALAKSDKPFFLAVGFTKPHLPFVAPQKYWTLYTRDSFSLPDNLGVPPGYPDYARNALAGELRKYGDIPANISPSEFPDALNRRLIHGYHACVSYTDRNIGVLLDALDKSGVAGNTIVVLWADHGWKLGDHSSWCKHTNFECDTRVPLILRHPGMPAAIGRSAALVELIDLYPTLCELCKLPAPAQLQGRSFAPVLASPAASHRDSAYSSYRHNAGKGQNVIGHSIRTDRYRYTEWWPKDSDTAVRHILTDIQADPGETTVAADSIDTSNLAQILRQRVLAARQLP